MSRFFFHVEDGPDDLGVELPSLAAAKCQAVRYAAEVLSDSAQTFWDKPSLKMWVADEQGLVLFSIDVVGNDAPIIRAANPMPPQIR
jgi:hypothetical protein